MMGLDMYLLARKEKTAEEKLDDLISNKEGSIYYNYEIATWRKHNALHGYMHELWLSTDPEENEFNCTSLYLSINDIDNLLEIIKDESLYSKGMSGFFFGSSDYSQEDIDYYKPRDRQFFETAKEMIEDGWEVFYDSWW